MQTAVRVTVLQMLTLGHAYYSLHKASHGHHILCEIKPKMPNVAKCFLQLDYQLPFQVYLFLVPIQYLPYLDYLQFPNSNVLYNSIRLSCMHKSLIIKLYTF